MVSPRKKVVDTPKLIQIMESWWRTMGSTMGFPILRQPRQPHMFTAVFRQLPRQRKRRWLKRQGHNLWILVDRFNGSLWRCLKMFEAIISKKSPKSIRGGSTALAPAMVGGGGWRGLTRHDRWWQLGQWRMDHDDIIWYHDANWDNVW